MASLNQQQKDYIANEIWSAFRMREPSRISEHTGGSVTMRTSSCPLHPNAFRHAKFVREVNNLPSVLNAWAKYVYAESKDWQHTEELAFFIWNQFDDTKEQKKKFTEKTTKQLQGMVFLAIQNQKHICHSFKELYSSRKIMDLLGIKENNWRQNYKTHWQRMNCIISKIDDEMLELIYKRTGQ